MFFLRVMKMELSAAPPPFRYDDFVTDGPGNSLGGLFVEDDPAKSAAGRRHGNCMLVTGDVRAC